MSYTLIAAGIIGGISGAIASVISRRFFKNKKNAKIIPVVVFALVTALLSQLGNRMFLPEAKKYEFKEELKKLEEANPLFSLIREYDKNAFDKLADMVVKADKEGKSKIEITRMVSTFGARLSAKYLANAPDDLIIRHTKIQMKIIEKLKIEDVNYAFQFVYPGIAPAKKEYSNRVLILFKDDPEGQDLIKVLRDMIRSGVSKNRKRNTDGKNLRIFLGKYRKSFPAQTALIANPGLVNTKNNFSDYVDASLHFYGRILKNPKKVSAGILRKLYSLNS